jgi:hypothetical protein
MKHDLSDDNSNPLTAILMNEQAGGYNKPLHDPVVIYDECGDSLWDAVLEQEYPALKYADIIF